MNHRAQPLSSDWPARRAFVPQGCEQQGRYEPTIPVVVDRLREDYDDEPEPLTRKQAVKFWGVALAPAIVLIGIAGFYIWARFGHVW